MTGKDAQDNSYKMACRCAWTATGRWNCMCESDGCWEKTRIGGIPCALCACSGKPVGPFYNDELELTWNVVRLRRVQREYPKNHPRRQEIEQDIFQLFEKIEEAREPKKIAARLARRLTGERGPTLRIDGGQVLWESKK